jgi:nicotinate-nucleotide--dimethylbenzimidazole phosphoribosyltransferase
MITNLRSAPRYQPVQPPCAADPDAVRHHLDSLTKPRGSLGTLESLALQLALIYGDPPPRLHRKTVFVLAADHGVTRQGVSAYPREVTAQMCRNYATGGAAVSVLARTLAAEVVAVDIGVDADLHDLDGLVHRKVRRGTRDLSEGAALTAHEVEQALDVGIGLVRDRDPLPDVIGLGEMGIGNTTPAGAITAALTGAPGALVSGTGTGIDDAGVAKKRRIIDDSVNRLRGSRDPLAVLAEVGGLEIAGLAGVVLGSAAAGRVVVLDGFIATAAALVAARIDPAVREYLVASHRSTEPGHGIQLEALQLTPLLNLGLRLGEGTGAVLAFPLLDAATAILREMATFESAGVTNRSQD